MYSLMFVAMWLWHSVNIAYFFAVGVIPLAVAVVGVPWILLTYRKPRPPAE